MPLRALIVDDEPPARRELRRLLDAHADAIVVTAEAGTLAEARAAIAAGTPDVVFLDLRLDREIGFEVLPAVPASTAVIFVTAHDEYAVKAFETNALDYLLKPVDPRRLTLTVARLGAARREQAGSATPQARMPDAVSANDWLLLRAGQGEEFVRAGAIACVIAEGDYTRVCTVDGRERLVHRTLRDWESRLPPDQFERVHRSAIANLRHVLQVERGPGYSARLALRGQPSLPISRRAAARLRNLHG